MNRKQSLSRGFKGGSSLGLAIVALAGLSGCGPKSENESDSGSSSGSGEKPLVFASVAPIAGLVERIGGDRIAVETLAGPGNDPHGFSPSPKQLVDLGNSKAFFVVGMPFEEELVAKLASGAENLPVVDVSKEIEKLESDHHHHDHEHEHEDAETEAEVEAEDDHGDEHDHDTHHDCGESDPHVWLSPELLKKQAAVIEATLHDLDPEGHEVFHANYEALIADLEALDAELTEELAPMKGQAFYVYHGAFAYFAQAYGLTQEAIEIAGRSPEPKRVFELIEQAKADDVRLILVQPQFDTRSAETIAEGIGGTVLPIDPVEKDVFATLRTLSEKIQESRSAPE